MLDRRQVIGGTALVAALLTAGTSSSVVPRARPNVAAVGPIVAPGSTLPIQVAPGLFIRPRDFWGVDLAPKAAPVPETVQFLLVHHTASPNNYGAGGARGVMRSVYDFHTSSEKGWPDVCYEFFVDHDGGIYEGRAGALAGPVRADATGGSQGFAQLVCLLGDFSETAPTAAMMSSLTMLLAWLADRYGLDTSPGATTSFVSRGSQRWKAGVAVTTSTIAGHRDMSFTVCPGDQVYDLFDAMRSAVHAQRATWPGAMWQAQRLP